MAQQPDPSIDAAIQAARADFAHRLVTKVADLETLVARGAWVDARRAAHKLCGSAGVYGFGALGAIASAIEAILSASENAPDAAAQRDLGEKLEEMRAEAERASQEMR